MNRPGIAGGPNFVGDGAYDEENDEQISTGNMKA
jgi:hypothetical protein